MSFKAALIVFFVLSLSGCNALEHLNEPPKQLVVQAKSTASVREIEGVLTKRFALFPVSALSSVESRIEGARITFIFKHGAPDRGLVEFLANHEGNLIARAEDGVVLFGTRDIDSASAVWAGQSSALKFSVSDEAARRVAGLSRNYRDKTIFITLDGEVLAAGKFAPLLGKRTLLVLKKDHAEMLRIAAVLRSGPLPEGVAIMENEL